MGSLAYYVYTFIFSVSILLVNYKTYTKFKDEQKESSRLRDLYSDVFKDNLNLKSELNFQCQKTKELEVKSKEVTQEQKIQNDLSLIRDLMTDGKVLIQITRIAPEDYFLRSPRDN